MNHLTMTEDFGASKIQYAPDSKGVIWATIDQEPRALISGDCLQLVRQMAFARIRREAK